MTNGPGRRPNTDEPRRNVGVYADPDLMRASKMLAVMLDVSVQSLFLYCFVRGINPLLTTLGRDELPMPPYLVPLFDKEETLPGLEDTARRRRLAERTLRKAKLPATTGSGSARVGLLFSQLAVVEPLAEELGLPKSRLVTWALVQHLNVMLEAMGRDRLAFPPLVARAMPPLLQELSNMPVESDPQEALDIPAPSVKGERLAS